MKEIKGLNKWGDPWSLWIERLNIVKRSVLPKLTVDECNSNQNLAGLFMGIDKLILKFIWRDFPGGPVGKTPSSQCRGPGFDP